MSDTQTTKLTPMPYHSGALPTPPLCEANHDFPPVATRVVQPLLRTCAAQKVTQ